MRSSQGTDTGSGIRRNGLATDGQGHARVHTGQSAAQEDQEEIRGER